MKKVEEILKDNPFKNVNGGLCVKGLEKVLKKLNVQKQAYHGKSFIGNHVHKMLDVSLHIIIIDKSCFTI